MKVITVKRKYTAAAVVPTQLVNIIVISEIFLNFSIKVAFVLAVEVKL